MFSNLKEGTQLMSIYMEEYTGFVYLWYDIKRKWFCIGSHMGSVDDGYTSSTGFMNNAYKKRPQDFKRKILAYYSGNDHRELFRLEQKYLDLIKIEELCLGENKKNNTIRYYNVKKTASGLNGEVASKIFKAAWDKNPDRKKNLSSRNKGEGNPMYGKTGENSPRYGKKHSPETIEKIRLSKTGVKSKSGAWNKGKKCPSISEGRLAAIREKWPNVDKEELMNLFVQGVKLSDICLHFGAHKTQIREIVKEMGYKNIRDLKLSLPKIWRYQTTYIF
jgi:hypothetical protein